MRPGGEISTRQLHFFWVADCSGSMSIDGKIQSLNSAIREALPHMKEVAKDNPFAKVMLRTIKFSHGADWHIKKPTLIDDFQWNDLVADELANSGKSNADVVFLLDTSGSMGDEIESVKSSCTAFADKIIKEGAKVRLGLVGFDIGGHSGSAREQNYKVHSLSTYTIGTWNLTSPENFKKNINTLSLALFGGGGCYIANNDTVDIFPHVVDVFDKTSDNAKILVIISDEMGSTDGLSKITSQLKKENITTHVMGVPNHSGAHERIAKETGGNFWDITSSGGVNDFSNLLGNVADTIAKEISKKLSDGSVSAGTDMGAAMKLLSEELLIPPMPERALPPVIVLISDGLPTDNFKLELQNFMKLPWAKKAVRLAIAIGADADLKTLQDFINHSEIKPLKANNPEQLTKFIRWMSTVVLKAVSDPPSKLEGGNKSGIPSPNFDVEESTGNNVW